MSEVADIESLSKVIRDTLSPHEFFLIVQFSMQQIYVCDVNIYQQSSLM